MSAVYRRPLRVGYVLKKFPRISETFVLNEILELERQGVDVTVFSVHRPDDGRFHAGLARLRRPVVYLPQRKSGDLLEGLRANLGLLLERREPCVEELETLLRSSRSDVWTVLAHGLEVAVRARAEGIQHLHAHFATVAAHIARAAHAMSGIPFSFTCHAKDIYREGVTRTGFTALARRAEMVVTVCEANRAHIRENLLDPDAGVDVRTLYNGVDLDAFHPSRRNPELPPLILGVGRLVEKKGFEHLVEAVAALRARGREVRCVIAGEGDQRPLLEERVAALGAGDAVELVGMRNHEEVAELLRRATVLVLPCVVGADGNRDALPTVLLEALAGGVPVVATPVGGIGEIVIHDETGLLVPPGESAALGAAIGELLDDPERAARLARAGRAHAERRFDLSANVAALHGMFRGVQLAAVPEER